MIDAVRDLPATGLGVLLATSAMLLFAVCLIITSVASRRLDSDCGSLLSAGVNLPVGLILVGDSKPLTLKEVKSCAPGCFIAHKFR